MDKMGTPTSIHFTKSNISFYKFYTAFCLVGLCKEKTKPCRNSGTFLRLVFVLCCSSWSPVIIVVFSNLARLPQTAQKATWKFQQCAAKYRGGRVVITLAWYHTFYWIPLIFLQKKCLQGGDLFYKMGLSQQRLQFPSTFLTETHTPKLPKFTYLKILYCGYYLLQLKELHEKKPLSPCYYGFPQLTCRVHLWSSAPTLQFHNHTAHRDKYPSIRQLMQDIIRRWSCICRI